MIDGRFLQVWDGLRRGWGTAAHRNALQQMRFAAQRLDERFPPNLTEEQKPDGSTVCRAVVSRDARVMLRAECLKSTRRISPESLGECFAELLRIFTNFEEEFSNEVQG